MMTQESETGMRCKKKQEPFVYLSHLNGMFCITQDENNTWKCRRRNEDPDHFESYVGGRMLYNSQSRVELPRNSAVSMIN